MKILCFGDSNTYGYDPRSCFGSRYPAQSRWVDMLANQTGWEMVNAGENGREIPSQERELLAFHRLLAGQKPVDLLIVFLGTNDLLQGNAPEAVAQRMEWFLNHMELDKSRILVMGLPPLQRGQWVPSQTLIDAATALNREYRHLSDRLGVDFADAGPWNIPMAFDGVHFTEEGHKAFAEALANHLNKGE